MMKFGERPATEQQSHESKGTKPEDIDSLFEELKWGFAEDVTFSKEFFINQRFNEIAEEAGFKIKEEVELTNAIVKAPGNPEIILSVVCRHHETDATDEGEVAIRFLDIEITILDRNKNRETEYDPKASPADNELAAKERLERAYHQPVTLHASTEAIQKHQERLEEEKREAGLFKEQQKAFAEFVDAHKGERLTHQQSQEVQNRFSAIFLPDVGPDNTWEVRAIRDRHGIPVFEILVLDGDVPKDVVHIKREDAE